MGPTATKSSNPADAGGIPHVVSRDTEADLQRLIAANPADPQSAPLAILTRDECFAMRDRVPLERVSDRLCAARTLLDSAEHTYLSLQSRRAGWQLPPRRGRDTRRLGEERRITGRGGHGNGNQAEARGGRAQPPRGDAVGCRLREYPRHRGRTLLVIALFGAAMLVRWPYLLACPTSPTRSARSAGRSAS